MTTTLNASTAGAGGFIATSDNSGVLALQTAGTTAITVDASQNVGIGNTSPAQKLDVTGSIKTSGQVFIGNNNYVGFANAAGTAAQSSIFNDTSNNLTFYNGSASADIFYTNATERMRINSSGYIGFNTSSFTNANGAPGFVYSYSGGSQNTVNVYTGSAVGYGAIFEYRRTGRSVTRCAQIGIQESNSGVGEVYVFSSAANSDVSGGVYLSNGSTSWSSLSDERLKDIIEPITNGLNKVSALRAVIGKFKTDAEGTRRSFLIAQDVQAVLPEAISPAKAQNDDTDYLGVSYTDVIPLLVASIKELKAINDTQAETINALTARIVALEQA